MLIVYLLIFFILNESHCHFGGPLVDWSSSSIYTVKAYLFNPNDTTCSGQVENVITLDSKTCGGSNSSNSLPGDYLIVNCSESNSPIFYGSCRDVVNQTWVNCPSSCEYYEENIGNEGNCFQIQTGDHHIWSLWGLFTGNISVAINSYLIITCTDLILCDGIHSTAQNVCNGNGECTFTGCSCDHLHTGPLCENEVLCDGIVYTNTTGVCNMHGICNGTDICVCDSGHTGDFCGDEDLSKWKQFLKDYFSWLPDWYCCCCNCMDDCLQKRKIKKSQDTKQPENQNAVNRADSVKLGDLSNFHGGSSYYCSPEILDKDTKYNPFMADVWAMGITLFALATNSLPFQGDTKEETYKLIKKGTFKFPDDFEHSDDLKDLIRNMLTKDWKKRYKISNIKNHQWFKRMLDIKKINYSVNLGEMITELVKKNHKVSLHDIFIDEFELESQLGKKIIQVLQEIGWKNEEKLIELLKFKTPNIEKGLFRLLERRIFSQIGPKIGYMTLPNNSSRSLNRRVASLSQIAPIPNNARVSSLKKGSKGNSGSPNTLSTPTSIKYNRKHSPVFRNLGMIAKRELISAKRWKRRSGTALLQHVNVNFQRKNSPVQLNREKMFSFSKLMKKGCVKVSPEDTQYIIEIPKSNENEVVELLYNILLTLDLKFYEVSPKILSAELKFSEEAIQFNISLRKSKKKENVYEIGISPSTSNTYTAKAIYETVKFQLENT